MDKYVELIKLLEKIFGKGSVSRTIGTRTNVVRFPKGKQPIDPTRAELDIEGTAAKNPDLVQKIENSIEDRMGDITKMNDQELLTYTANVRRLANFKEPPPLPEADVIKFGSGEEIKGKGLETLIEKQGTRFPPTTDIGKLEAAGKRLEKIAEEMNPANIARQEAERQAMIARQYEGKGFAGGVFGPSGMYRAVARNFLLDEAAKGKIKLSPDTIKNLQERNYISGGQPLMYADPIRIMRYHYGDDVFEKIPLDKIPTGAPSEIKDVMSKVEAPPIRTEPPKTPGGYLTPGEYRANIEEMQRIEDAIKRRESRFADMTEEEIQNELQQYGSKRSSFEMGLEQDYPEEFAKYKKPKDIDEPEGKAYGGRIGYETGGGTSEEQNLIEKILSGKIKIGADFTNKNKEDPFNKYGFGERDTKDPRLGIEYIMDPGDERSSKIGISVGPKGGSINFMKPFSEKLSEEKNEDVIQTYIDFARNVWGVNVTEQEARKALGIYDMPDTSIRNELPPEEVEEKAYGGRIGYSGGSKLEGILDIVKKDYDKSITKKIIDKGDEINETVADALRRQIESRLTDEQRKKMNRFLGIRDATLQDIIKDSSKENISTSFSKRKEEVDDERKEEANGGRIGFSKGKKVMSEIDKLIEQLNKKTKGKKSMESVNPKTGEVTVPKRPIRRAEEPTGTTVMDPEPEIVDEKSIPKTGKKTTQRYDQDIVKAADNIYPNYDDPKIAADQIVDSYAQMKYGLEDQYGLSNKERMDLYTQAYDYVMDHNRKIKSIYKKGDPITEENFGSSPFAPSQETLNNLKIAREQSKKMSEQELQNEMNRVLNQYDKSMFVKNEFGAVDITSEENQRMMAMLLKRDHPELYNQIYNLGEDLSQKQILDEFDITGREPNAKGGIAGLL